MNRRRRIGENILREWNSDPLRQDIFLALDLADNNGSAGLKYLEQLAEQGSALSMMYLGHAIYVGRYGSKVDHVLGEFWLRNAIKGGSIEACFVLAKHLQSNGRGKEAIDIFYQAAEAGYSPAMHIMGLKYYSGQYVEMDFDKAEKYFRRAAASGHLYGILWASRVMKQRRKNLFSLARHISTRILIVFRLVFTLLIYPSSDRLRR